MAIAYRDTYVTLGGLHLGNLAIDCYDWSSLFAVPSKRGKNRVLPGQSGREARPRINEEFRAGLAIRLRGDYTDNNEVIYDTEANWATNIYARLSTLQATCMVNTIETLTFTAPSISLSADAQIEEMGPPDFRNPWIITLVVDLTLPNGPIGA